MPWVYCTPLGGPVEPVVKMIAARSSTPARTPSGPPSLPRVRAVAVDRRVTMIRRRIVLKVRRNR
jgi:hypothetical protein